MIEVKCKKISTKSRWEKCLENNTNEAGMKRTPIELSEEKSTFVGLNSNNKAFHTCKIGQCLIPEKAQTSQNADYLLLEKQKGDIWMIELKGNNIKKAYGQIEETIKLLSGTLADWGCGSKKYACIVLSDKPTTTKCPTATLEEARRKLRNHGYTPLDNTMMKNKVWGKLVIDLDTGKIIEES